MTTKTPEPQYRATMARNGNKGAGRKLSAKRKAALARALQSWDLHDMALPEERATNEKPPARPRA